jgi:hypothetical protein
MADGLAAENRRLAEENQQLRQRNATLASLYVAATGLLGAADRDEALTTLQEIIVNLIGCEQFAVFAIDQADGGLALIGHAGVEPAHFADLARYHGIINRTAGDGVTRVAPFTDERGPEEMELNACVPLMLDGRPRAVMALFRLLPQKLRFELADRELFELLSLNAARALYRGSR